MKMRRAFLFGALWLLFQLLSGCSLIIKGIPVEESLRITAPEDGTVAFVGQPVYFAVHMENFGTPSTGTLEIHGPRDAEFALDFTPRGDALLVAEAAWVPEVEGEYTVEVYAYVGSSKKQGNNRVHLQIVQSRPIQRATSITPPVTLVSPTPAVLVTPTATVPRPTATPTNTPTASPTPWPCHMAKFIADVTVPDGTRMDPGQRFTKTWRLQNVGSCTWTPDYSVVFVSGERMGAPSATPIGQTVAPGQMVDVSVQLTAPQNEGTYRGNFKLRSPDGQVFGLGAQQNPFYVEIQVAARLPDLAVESVSFAPDPFVIGQSAVVTVVVVNQGQGAAGPFGVSWLNNTQARAASCGWQVNGLGPGQRQTLQCTISGNEYSQPGQYTTRTIVDVSQQVAESNEGNNERLQPYQVVSGDTSGPAIKASRSGNEIYWPSGCGANSVTITAYVGDPSGVAWVRLQYRVVNQRSTGQWITKDFALVGTNQYQVTLTGADLEASLNPPLNAGQGYVEYIIMAQDNVGNQSRQSQPNLTLYYCLY